MHSTFLTSICLHDTIIVHAASKCSASTRQHHSVYEPPAAAAVSSALGGGSASGWASLATVSDSSQCNAGQTRVPWIAANSVRV